MRDMGNGETSVLEPGNARVDAETRAIWAQALQKSMAGRFAERVLDTVRETDPPKVVLVDSKRETLMERLRSRKMVQWLLAYLAVGWMVLQLNDVLADVWGVPLSVQKALSLALGLGVLPGLVVAWYHGERGSQSVCCTEATLVGVLVVGALATVWRVCFA
jgi:hypothetical protein